LESATTALTLPVPVLAAVVREVTFSGSVQVCTTDDFSVQTFTSQELPLATATADVAWLPAELSTPRTADAETVVTPVLRYAATLSTDFDSSVPVTVTSVPASPATAALVQARPRTPLPLRVSIRVQPGMVSVIVPVVEFVTRNSSSRSWT
jgi:hypothetical protein